MTNKELKQAVLDETYPILKDLSGNGHDMELHGFVGEDGYGWIDEDGNLAFDGVNDYASLASIGLSKYENLTIFAKFSNLEDTTSGKSLFEIASQEDGQLIVKAYTASGTAYITYRGKTSTGISRTLLLEDDVLLEIHNNRCYINGVNKYIYSAVCDVADSKLSIGANGSNKTNVLFTLESFIIVGGIISEEEREYIKDNLLISEEPSKFTINYWYINDNGEKILKQTKRYNNGTILTELPEMDLTTKDCAYEWYYQYDMDSEGNITFDDEDKIDVYDKFNPFYVDCDLDLYCSTRPIYERILEQIEIYDEENDTDLKDSLVGMWSAQLQGMTNEDIASGVKLLDLSGNDYDFTLSGFTSDLGRTKGIINNQLVLKKWAEVKNTTLRTYNGVSLFASIKEIDSIAWASPISIGALQGLSSMTSYLLCIQYTGTTFRTSAANNSGFLYENINNGFNKINARVDCINKKLYYNKQSITNSNIKDSYSEIPILINPFAIKYANVAYQYIVVFGKTLTDEETEFIDSILPSAPSSNITITYNYGDTLLDTETIASGSKATCGTYPLDNIYQSDKWYFDSNCTDEVPSGCMFDKDVTLYCSRIKVSDYVVNEIEAMGLKDNLVAMYSPRLQGMTKKSVIEDATLVDLSGKDSNFELFNFTSDEIVLQDNKLIFDGVDDYALSNATPLTLSQDETLIISANNTKGVIYSWSVDNSTQNSRLGSLKQMKGCSIKETTYNGVAYYIYDGNEKTLIDNNGNQYSVTFNYNDAGKLGLGTLRPSANSYYSDLKLDYIIRFSSKLNTEQITKIQSLLNTTTLPLKTHSVKFMYNGSQVADTIYVQHCSNIVNTPIVDISNTQMIKDWYYADGTKYTINTFIEDDVILYGQPMQTKDYMLSQLEALTLEDGTTAKSHLVCMYSPKLQGATKESILADTKLNDLSGNEHDVTLYNFTEEQDIIASDGAIVFDGVNNYGHSILVEDFTNFTTITCFEIISLKNYASPAVIKFGGNSRWIERSSYTNNGKNVTLKHNGTTADMSGLMTMNRKNISVITSTYTNINGEVINYDKSTTATTSTNQYIGTSDEATGTHEYKMNAKIHCRMIFNADMAIEDVNTILTILKLQ